MSQSVAFDTQGLHATMIRPLLACLLSAIVACTPLGLWIYDDPTLEVSRVRVDRNGAGAAPVVVGLAVWNPNLYALSTARLELQLRLDDLTVGHFDRDSIIPLPQGGLADVALPLTVPSGRIRDRIRAMASGTHRFAVEGRATLSTPFGEREVPFEHVGDLAFGGTAEARASTDSNQASVHPGSEP
ncbi:MAG TPA: LEA type 2 family protein [Gemmatimonadales bacterium]|jgi:LEA14-like dessication related protein